MIYIYNNKPCLILEKWIRKKRSSNFSYKEIISVIYCNEFLDLYVSYSGNIRQEKHIPIDECTESFFEIYERVL